ncbi:alpha/beta hydrolase [Microbacterium sp. NPDC076895]|uniref:alpha/beta fold hydrolase n=1 Tax=Microbacterium sp. NPDC076895 TaxID=3154957 RepID=UPI003442BEFC
MDTTISADGTRIAYETFGSGRPVVIVGGAFSTASDGVPLAEALAALGLHGVTVDRRARGSSGDTAPYAPEREAEDVAAVVDAVGGRAALLGHSSGAVLALLAASRGAQVSHLFLSEPPLGFGHSHVPADLPETLQGLLDEGRREDVVTIFQRQAVGLPDAMIEQIRESPMFPHLVGLAQSVVYDAALARACDSPNERMLGLDVPTAVLCGAETFPFLEVSSRALAEAMPAAELVIVPESRGHRPDPVATARVVAERIGGV